MAAVVVAYGQIVPDPLIEWPEFGAINIHPSLLPRWRGAAPIQHTVYSGDTETGTCIMSLDSGLDTGPVYARKTCSVEKTDTLGSLHDKLCSLSAKLLIETLPKVFSGDLLAEAQPDIELPYAEKWTKEDASLKWH
jgi:methionyl-tRNA formyltransferase